MTNFFSDSKVIYWIAYYIENKHLILKAKYVVQVYLISFGTKFKQKSKIGGVMRLEKNNVHMNKIIKKEMVTFYVTKEDRITEPDKEIESIINQKETVTANSITVRENQITINGAVDYCLLYYPKNSDTVCGFEREMPFEENIKIMGIDSNDMVNVFLEAVSANVKIIDEKSYIYKIQIKAYITVEKIEDLEVITAIENEKAMIKNKTIEGLKIVANKSDTLRINEQISIPSRKGTVGKIVWSDVRIKNKNIMVMDGYVQINGQLSLFIIYIPEQEAEGEQWLEQTLDFGGKLEIDEAKEGMVSYIETVLDGINIQPQMNQDNEVSDLSINALLKMDIKLYEEIEYNVVDDVYEPGANLVPVRESKKYDKLLVKNGSRTKETVKMKIDESKGQILQICNSSAEIKIHNIVISDNGIKVMGTIKTCIMYISTEDSRTICCQCSENDFEHRIDAEGIEADDRYYLDWNVEQVSANMLNASEVEIKAVIALEVIVFKQIEDEFVMDIKEEEMDMEALNNAPFIKGYVVQKGDTLWKLAKENYTTMEKIIDANQLENENIKIGDRLLIIKSCQCQ